MALLLPYLDFLGSPCPRNYHCHIFIVNLIVRIIVDIQYLCFELQHYLHHVLMVSLCFPVTVGYAVMPFLSCLLGKFLHMTHYLSPRSFLLQIPIFRVKSSCFARIVRARVSDPESSVLLMIPLKIDQLPKIFLNQHLTRLFGEFTTSGYSPEEEYDLKNMSILMNSPSI